MFIKRGIQDPANCFFVENYHVYGTIFLISQDFAFVEQIFFFIFSDHLIVLSDRDGARKSTIENNHEKIQIHALASKLPKSALFRLIFYWKPSMSY